MPRIVPVTVALVLGITGCAATPPSTFVAEAHRVAAARLDGAGTSAQAAARFVPQGRLAADTPAAQPASPSGPGADEPARGALPSFRETLKRDVREAPSVLWDDTKAVYGNFGNLLFLAGAGGVSVALRPEADDDVEDHFAEHRLFADDWRDAFGAIGNPATHFAVAGLWYLAGQQMDDAKTYEVGKRALSALTITGLTTLALKVAANTEAPNGENLAWPSGHVSSSMAMATVMNDAYGPLVGVPLFGLTALVGLERLDSGEHHLSDLVFGAALGWVVAQTVMDEHELEIFGGDIVPYVSPEGDNAGLAWVLSFD